MEVFTSENVIYEVSVDGPLKGLKNGTRKYKVDFSRGINLGTYHILDGARIEARYPGQRRTCGRCQKTSATGCLGNGIGRLCQENGGIKVRLADFMVEHWKSIGFDPSEFVLDDELDDEADLEVRDSNEFTPVKNSLANVEINKFTGVLIKNLPIALSDPDLVAVAIEGGASPSDDIKIHKPKAGLKAILEIHNIDNSKCQHLIGNLNGKLVHGTRIYCKGLSDLYTPEKNSGTEKQEDNENSVTKSSPEVKETQKLSPSPTIPGLHVNTLTKSQLKKLKKNRSKELNQSNVLGVNLSEFDFDSVDECPSGSTSSSISKRPRSSPQEDRRTRQRSSCEIDLR